jgi:hypothetical protein
MSGSTKQIYIPSINIKGYRVEEVGGGEDRVVYPGKSFDLTLDISDFQDPEEYHTTWITLTRAVKAKLIKDAKLNTT